MKAPKHKGLLTPLRPSTSARMKDHQQQHDMSDPNDETAFLESACTSVTDESEDNNNSNNSWFGGIGAWATTLRETAGGVVKVVKTCAINVAAEIAQLEDEEDGLQDSNSGEPLYLPWQICNEETGDIHEDMELQQKIFQLSRDERNFLEPYSSVKWNNNNNNNNNDDEDDDSGSFVLDDARVYVIRQLLTMDPQLSAAHARLSGRKDVHEITFWRNYFYACDQTRKDHHHSNNDNYSCWTNRHGVLQEEPIIESSNLEELSQKSLASHQSVNSLVPDDELSDANKVDDDAPNSPESLADDASYVCLSTGRTSPLGSVKSFKSSRSAGSMVLVEAPLSAQNSFLDYGLGK